jgi:hypothetical protein
MKKLVLGGAVSLAFAAGSLFLPAQAADFEGCLSDAPGGNPAAANVELCGGGSMDGTGYIYVDGAEGNQDPFDGYISAANDGSLDEDGVCASDQGDAHEEYDANGNRIEDNDEQPTCANP